MFTTLDPFSRTLHHPRWRFAPLGCLAASGIAVGLALMIWTWSRAASMSADGAHYMELAERAWRMGPRSGMDWYSGPGYPVAVGWLYGLVGDLDFAGRLSSLLFAFAMLVAVGLLSLRLFGRAAAAVAVALLAVHISFVRHSVMAETDVAYGCWLVWSVLATWELKHATRVWGQMLWSVLAGLSLGIGYLTRPEAVPLGLLLGVWYLVPASARYVSPPTSHWLRRLAWVIVVVALCLAIASPYLLELRSELGRWSLSGKERSIVLKFVPDKEHYEEVLKLGVSGALLQKPSRLLHWLPYHLHWGLPQLVKSLHPIVLLMAGFGLLRRRVVPRAAGAAGLLLWVSVPFVLFFFLTFPGRRYFMQTLGPWTILAGVGTVELAGLIANWRERLARSWTMCNGEAAGRRAFLAAVSVPPLLMAACTWWASQTPLNEPLASERRIGERILRLAGPGHRVLSFTVTAFYARGERVPLWGPMQGIVRCHGYGKPLSYETFVDYVRRHGAEYVVLDRDLRHDCPEFLERVRPGDFELVFDDSADDKGPCFVYRYVGRAVDTPHAN